MISIELMKLYFKINTLITVYGNKHHGVDFRESIDICCLCNINFYSSWRNCQLDLKAINRVKLLYINGALTISFNGKFYCNHLVWN